jgi:hypothetical protein
MAKRKRVRGPEREPFALSRVDDRAMLAAAEVLVDATRRCADWHSATPEDAALAAAVDMFSSVVATATRAIRDLLERDPRDVGAIATPRALYEACGPAGAVESREHRIAFRSAIKQIRRDSSRGLAAGGRMPFAPPPPDLRTYGIVAGERGKKELRRRAVVALCDYLLTWREDLRPLQLRRAIDWLIAVDSAFDGLSVAAVEEVLAEPRIDSFGVAARLSLRCGALGDARQPHEAQRKAFRRVARNYQKAFDDVRT